MGTSKGSHPSRVMFGLASILPKSSLFSNGNDMTWTSRMSFGRLQGLSNVHSAYSFWVRYVFIFGVPGQVWVRLWKQTLKQAHEKHPTWATSGASHGILRHTSMSYNIFNFQLFSYQKRHQSNLWHWFWHVFWIVVFPSTPTIRHPWIAPPRPLAWFSSHLRLRRASQRGRRGVR